MKRFSIPPREERDVYKRQADSLANSALIQRLTFEAVDGYNSTISVSYTHLYQVQDHSPFSRVWAGHGSVDQFFLFPAQPCYICL